MTTAEALRKAKSLLEKDGWCQGWYHDDDGARCAIGALWDAAISPECHGEAVTYLRRAAGIEPAPSSITDWNDVSGRTKEEVLIAFDKAIALAEAQP